ncbi:MAG TPA: DUF4197 domain-containing protein [Bacteroidales bacterium]|nr:DUF4197 domain-containing protein [Bacteroidales bacterium]
MKKIVLALVLLLPLASCDILQQVAKEAAKGSSTSLTANQIVSGLKTALEVGTEESVKNLSATDGFYGNPLLRIPLPPEADIIKKNINNPIFKTLGVTNYLNNQLEEVVKRMNRAAEFAAPEAKNIFIDAIRGMSIADGSAILKGKYGNPPSGFDSTAATRYLKDKTYAQLTSLFAPHMKTALDKPIIANISTSQAWEGLTTAYNKGAALIGQPKVETNLENFATQKALDGVFYKIGLIEKDIRKNPGVWAARTAKAILKIVF